MIRQLAHLNFVTNDLSKTWYSTELIDKRSDFGRKISANQPATQDVPRNDTPT
jgi:hypothetical protein